MTKFIVYVATLFAISAPQAANEVLKLGSALFDNGPIITSSGTGVGGANESVLENNTLSMTSFGTAHHSGANLRVAEDFIISGSPWLIDSIDFFAYQTNETASTITSINLRIWDGMPNSPGSTVVFGDTSTNVLNSTADSGILRVNEDTQGTVNDRQIAISNVQINQLFTPGTYWLDWQSDGSGLSGPFVPHVTIPGQTTTGNALLSTDNGATYGALQDLGSLTNQGLPLIINGTVIVAPSDSQPVPVLNVFGLSLLIIMIMFLFYAKQYHRLKSHK